MCFYFKGESMMNANYNGTISLRFFVFFVYIPKLVVTRFYYRFITVARAIFILHFVAMLLFYIIIGVWGACDKKWLTYMRA